MNRITLVISRGKTFLDIFHKGEKIGEIKVSDSNRTTQSSLQLTSDASVTRFKISRAIEVDNEELNYNSEEFNR
jgi:hypothetical protein